MSMVEKLAYIKKLRHLTSEEIAQQSGVPLGTLNKIFSGQTKNPAIGPVEKITQVLHIPIQYLLDDDLPPECNISTSLEDGGILLLSEDEVHLLMKFRTLNEPGKRSVETMTGLLAAPALQLAGCYPLKRTFCYVPAVSSSGIEKREPFDLKPVLIPETDDAVRQSDFAVLLTDGSMEPLYPAGSVLLCKKESSPKPEYAFFLLNHKALVRRPQNKRGITKLVAPNVAFKDILILPEDNLEYIATIIGTARSYRWA